jgi:asparagine synthetase B (glutamine-hydrolysing)
MKVLARRAAATVMPDEIAYREQIAHTSPLLRWLNDGKLTPLLDRYLQRCHLKEEGIFDISAEVGKMNDLSNPWFVWNTICYIAWKKNFFNNSWETGV